MDEDKFLGLRTTIYKVSDLNEAKKWYSDILGKQPYFNEPFYVGFDIGGFELGLLPLEDKEQNPGTTVMAYWGVDDIEHSYQRLIELGASAHEQPESVGGDIKVAAVLDPWGNPFGIIYNPSFKIESNA